MYKIRGQRYEDLHKTQKNVHIFCVLHIRKKLYLCRVKNILNRKLILFFLVAGLNTLFGYVLFAGLIFIGLPYVLATLLAQILGVLFNFKTYGVLVFKNNDNSRIFRFVGVYILIYIINISLMFLFRKLWGLNDYEIGAILAIPMGLLGFFLNKRFVFFKQL